MAVMNTLTSLDARRCSEQTVRVSAVEMALAVLLKIQLLLFPLIFAYSLPTDYVINLHAM
jgi:hypothetical protein